MLLHKILKYPDLKKVGPLETQQLSYRSYVFEKLCVVWLFLFLLLCFFVVVILIIFFYVFLFCFCFLLLDLTYFIFCLSQILKCEMNTPISKMIFNHYPNNFMYFMLGLFIFFFVH